jgi:hypothetical protein
MGDSAHTTLHTTPGMTHCPQIYTLKYLRNAKKLDVRISKSIEFIKFIDLRGENQAWKFPSVCKFEDNGSTKVTLHL